MDKANKRILILALIIPPLFILGILIHYHSLKKESNEQYLAQEVKYQRPDTERTPAEKEKKDDLHKKQIFHEAFSK